MRSLRIQMGIVPAVAALWLCAAQPARAGDGGGEDLGSLQSYINQVCAYWGMNSCPQIPTIIPISTASSDRRSGPCGSASNDKFI